MDQVRRVRTSDWCRLHAMLAPSPLQCILAGVCSIALLCMSDKVPLPGVSITGATHAGMLCPSTYGYQQCVGSSTSPLIPVWQKPSTMAVTHTADRGGDAAGA